MVGPWGRCHAESSGGIIDWISAICINHCINEETKNQKARVILWLFGFILSQMPGVTLNALPGGLV